MSDTGNL